MKELYNTAHSALSELRDALADKAGKAQRDMIRDAYSREAVRHIDEAIVDLMAAKTLDASADLLTERVEA